MKRALPAALRLHSVAAVLTRNGSAEAFIGDWTVRIQWQAPEEPDGFGGVITMQILSDNRAGDY